MEFILYVIFIFTLLLIIFSVNEYYESCLIKTCQPKFELIPASGTTPSSCKSCSNDQNVETYEPNTCKITKCSGNFKPNANGSSCEQCSVPNALTYSTDGTCKVLTCKPGYTTDGITCTKCTNTTNVFTYNEKANNTCDITQCYPGFTVTGTGITQNCNTQCTNTTGVDVSNKNTLGYISAYDQPIVGTDKSNVPV